ncbi:MAG: carbamoyltransferase HypF [Asgard group archaeon]|nr:carbamoyltransferase HypF [Asgard group archaeon]
MNSRVKIICRGIVQGIGFRPFVFQTAKRLELLGFVRNQGDAGVLITAEGSKKNLDKFLQLLQTDKPYLTRYEDFQFSWEPFQNEFLDFEILKSSKKSVGGISYLPPDISICEKCLEDMTNPNDNRYKYAFTSCAICGPRYTTITQLPYDRPNTTMIDFPFCETCSSEYNDPFDRRHHAQTTCCNICGPQLSLYNNEGEYLELSNLYSYLANLINEGQIIAIKGIGGTHLACSALDDEPIFKLRTRKGKRKNKPFAVISSSIKDVQKYANITHDEEQLLLSHRKPIVLLRKKNPFPLSNMISPDLFNIGVMLPYSGIHSLLLDELNDPALILTSANPSDIPMYVTNKSIISNLKNMADYFLLHNRRIYQRVDDSVIRLSNNIPTIIRRSRGWVPEPINLPFNLSGKPTLGVGPLLTSTGAIAFSNRCFPTQYIGDVNSLETLDFLESAIKHMQFLLSIDSFGAIGSDLHPRYASSVFAEKYANNHNLPHLKVQHHYAHSLALMIDNQVPLADEIISIVADGVGYGTDGNIWGGEILHCSYDNYSRIGHLEEQLMVGGDRATHFPIRMLAGILSKKLSLTEIENLLIEKYPNSLPGSNDEVHVLISQLKKGLNLHKTSSTGRILASTSALLKICFERTYEGEPAIVLESIASYGKLGKVIFDIPEPKNGIIGTTDLILQSLEKFQSGIKPKHIAIAVQYELAKQFSDVAIERAKSLDIRKIGFSGGVAYNDFITKHIAKKVLSANLEFIQHKSLPSGDGGISTGQAIYAALQQADK